MAYIRFFRHYLHVPFMLLGVVEAFLFGAAFYLSSYIHFFGDGSLFVLGLGDLVPSALIFVFFNLLAMTATGVYQSRVQEGMVEMQLRTLLSIFLALFLAFLVSQIFTDLFWYLQFDNMSFASLISFFLLGISRSLVIGILGSKNFRRHVLVLGAGNRARRLIDELSEPMDRAGFVLHGFVPMAGEEVKVDPSLVCTVGERLYDYLVQHGIDEVVVAPDERREKLPLDQLIECRVRGIQILDPLVFFERETRKLALEMLNPSALIFSEGFVSSNWYEVPKRVIDIGVSLLAILLSWPIMLLTALAIKLEDGWVQPVFYRQCRVGQFGRHFDVIKFRSMVVDAETSGSAVWAQKNDPRVTRVGAFIRKYRIDELAQIFNVLKGDMSFVGPRPERPYFVEKLESSIPYYGLRHRVKPGITGWAQLRFAYGDCEEDSREKLRYDLYYLKNQSFLLNIMILIQTAEVVLFKKGSR